MCGAAKELPVATMVLESSQGNLHVDSGSAELRRRGGIAIEGKRIRGVVGRG